MTAISALTITSDPTYVKIEFNALKPYAKFEVSGWRKEAIHLVCITDDDIVCVRAAGAINDYMLTAACVSRPGATPVASVDGVVPTSNRHLFELLLEAGR